MHIRQCKRWFLFRNDLAACQGSKEFCVGEDDSCLVVDLDMCKKGNAKDDFPPWIDLDVYKNTNEVCAREDDIAKVDLGLHKDDDVKDDFCARNDLATPRQHSWDNCGGEDDAAKADLDLCKDQKNTHLFIMNTRIMDTINVSNTLHISTYLNQTHIQQTTILSNQLYGGNIKSNYLPML